LKAWQPSDVQPFGALNLDATVSGTSQSLVNRKTESFITQTSFAAAGRLAFAHYRTGHHRRDSQMPLYIRNFSKNTSNNGTKSCEKRDFFFNQSLK